LEEERRSGWDKGEFTGDLIERSGDFRRGNNRFRVKIIKDYFAVFAFFRDKMKVYYLCSSKNDDFDS